MTVKFVKKVSGVSDDTPLLTVAHVRQLQAELEADLCLLADLPARIEFKRQRLDAARHFLPAGFDWDSANTPDGPPVQETLELRAQTPAQEPATWIGTVFRILDAADHGLSHKELMEAIKKTPLGQSPTAGDKGFYNAIGRLAERGDLIKHGGLLYSARVAKEIQDRGEKLPDVTMDVRRRTRGSGQIVLNILAKHPKGLTAPALKKAVAEVPEAPKSIQEHGQYIYNILSTLIGAGAVTKKDGMYRLPKAKG